MSKTFIKDPREVVKPGDIVRVKVLDVDKPRKRISLTLRLDDEAGSAASRPASGARSSAGHQSQRSSKPDKNSGKPAAGGALADALRRAGLNPRQS
jgi:uncharacterized protein